VTLSRVRKHAPFGPTDPNICVRGGVTDIINCAKFFENRFRGYGAGRPWKMAFPTEAIHRAYNSAALLHRLWFAIINQSVELYPTHRWCSAVNHMSRTRHSIFEQNKPQCLRTDQSFARTKNTKNFKKIIVNSFPSLNFFFSLCHVSSETVWFWGHLVELNSKYETAVGRCKLQHLNELYKPQPADHHPLLVDQKPWLADHHSVLRSPHQLQVTEVHFKNMKLNLTK